VTEDLGLLQVPNLGIFMSQEPSRPPPRGKGPGCTAERVYIYPRGRVTSSDFYADFFQLFVARLLLTPAYSMVNSGPLSNRLLNRMSLRVIAEAEHECRRFGVRRGPLGGFAWGLMSVTGQWRKRKSVSEERYP
jgi:hypothetical protein